MIKRGLLASVILLGCAADPAPKSISYETIGAFDVSAPGLIAGDAVIEKLGGEFWWSEGPVWIEDGDYLLFTDVPQNRIHAYKEGQDIRVWMEPAGVPDTSIEGQTGEGANGLVKLDAEHILLPDHGSRTLYKLNLKTQKRMVIADSYQGKKLNSPNDAALHNSGIIFFTDPPYGLKDQDKSIAKELNFNGVFAVLPSGEVQVIDKTLSRPNGIILSPDQATLYVANSDADDAKWRAYPVSADGTVGEGRDILNVTDDVKAGKPGLPDGMAMAGDGTLFATGPGGVLILSPEGKRLGLIETGTPIANCTFGDDGRTLYMTSQSFLARIRTQKKGLGF